MALEDFPVPSQLGPNGRHVWGLVRESAKAVLEPVDMPTLEVLCMTVDRLHAKFENQDARAEVAIGILIDKMLLLSTKFGMTPADRKNLGLKEVKKKVERPKTKLDGMKPEDFRPKS